MMKLQIRVTNDSFDTYCTGDLKKDKDYLLTLYVVKERRILKDNRAIKDVGKKESFENKCAYI